MPVKLKNTRRKLDVGIKMNSLITRTSVPLVVCSTALFAFAANSQAVIDNGTVQLGINPEGNLITSGIGLTFLPTSGEALAPGCACEGWGIADMTTGFFGKAGESFGDANLSGATLSVSGTGTSAPSTGSSAVASVDVIFGPQSANVMHGFSPSSSNNLYQVDVTITNIGGDAITELVYRRAMDWDVPPTEFREFVTIQGHPAARLIGSSDNGFADGNPNVPLGTLAADAVLNGNFEDSGPADHGAVFDFGFGALAPGDSTSFTIYYGAAASEADALTALAAVGAEVFSLGQPSTADGDTLGTPNTFIFAFAGVGGTPLGAPPGNSSLNVLRDLAELIVMHHSRLPAYRMDGLDSGGGYPGYGEPASVSQLAAAGGTSIIDNAYGVDGLKAIVNVSFNVGNVDSSANNTGFDFTGFGVNLGLDYEFETGVRELDSFLVGAALGYQHIDADHDVSSGETTANAYSVSLYSGLSAMERFYGDAIFTYSYVDYRNVRRGLMSTFTSDPNANVFSGVFRAGFDIPGRAATPISERELMFGPYVEAGYMYADFDGFTESNNGLSASSFDSDSLLVGGGVRGSLIMQEFGQSFFAKGDVALLYDVIGDDLTVLQTTAGGSTIIQPIDANDDVLFRINVGVGTATEDGITGSLEYLGHLSASLMDHTLLARIKLDF